MQVRATKQDFRNITIAAELMKDRVPVLGGTGGIITHRVAELTLAAKKAGCAGAMIMPPYYAMVNRKEVVQHYKTISDTANLPILLYNSPRRTGGVNIDIDTLGALCDALPVVGIKESSRDFFHQSHVIRQFARRISVLIGPGHYVFPGLALGAAGFLATGAEFLGDSVGRIRPLAAAKPCAEARDLHHALTTVYQTLMSLGT
ncbi:MAG: dihydrodipicolinate synthase family protein [Rhodospirillales bacterium]|nr:dihydrodipicolinate synthase family protein [Rhodospirillales bacterium]